MTAFVNHLKVLMTPEDFAELSEYSKQTRIPIHAVAAFALRQVTVDAYWDAVARKMRRECRAEK
jgi:hypothetical protein